MINPFEAYLRPFEAAVWLADLQGAPLPLEAAQSWWPVDAPQPRRAFALACEGLRVVVLEGPPIFVDLVGRGWVSLLWVVEGELELIQGPTIHRARAGDWLVVPPGQLVWRSGACSVLALLVPPRCLQVARDLLLPGEAEDCGDALAALRLVKLGGAEACGRSLLAVLEQTLGSMALLQAEVSGLPERLGMADQVFRLLALLLWPELLPPSEDRSSFVSPVADGSVFQDAGGKVNSFESLLSFILDNLESPLSLSVLEEQSHYSRRSLQYAFRERLGCTATQWIRAQRLERAYDRLVRARDVDTVSGIARACGYRSMGLFSVEFQQRFHVKPSVLLRQSRIVAPVAAQVRHGHDGEVSADHGSGAARGA